MTPIPIGHLEADCREHVAGMASRRGKRWAVLIGIDGGLLRFGAESREFQRMQAEAGGTRLVGVYTSRVTAEQLLRDAIETAQLAGVGVEA